MEIRSKKMEVKMKKQIIMSLVFLAGMLLAEGSLFSQQLPDYKYYNYKLRPRNAEDKITYDYGTRLGYITREEIVLNNQGKTPLFIKNGKLYHAGGKPVGKARKNGRYLNYDGYSVVKAVRKTVSGKGEMHDRFKYYKSRGSNRG